MKKIKPYVILFFLTAPFVISGQNSAEGDGIVPCGGKDNPCQLCHLFELFANLVEFVLITVVPPLAALFFVYGGILFYTAAGDPNKITKARGVLVSVVIGIAIVYGAHFFISMLLDALGVADVQWPNITICD